MPDAFFNNPTRNRLQDIIDKLYRNPKKIFNIPDQRNTYIEIDMNDEWIIPDSMPYSKSKWTPFAGMKVRGSVHRVVLRGEVAYVEGQVLVNPGFGQDIRDPQYKSKMLPALHVQTVPYQFMDPICKPPMLADNLLSPNYVKADHTDFHEEEQIGTQAPLTDGRAASVFLSFLMKDESCTCMIFKNVFALRKFTRSICLSEYV